MAYASYSFTFLKKVTGVQAVEAPVTHTVLSAVISTAHRSFIVVKCAVKCLCKLAPLVVVVAQSHHSEGGACDLLVEKEHESSSQHRLQQLRFKAFKKTQHTILPTEENQHENVKEQEVKEQNY